MRYLCTTRQISCLTALLVYALYREFANGPCQRLRAEQIGWRGGDCRCHGTLCHFAHCVALFIGWSQFLKDHVATG